MQNTRTDIKFFGGSLMRRIFLDIETLPPDTETSRASSSLDTCADQEFRDLALKAEKGRLLTIGVIIEENNKVIHQGLLGRDKATGLFHLNEAKTLRAFWSLIGRVDPYQDVFIGHNILDFDLAFLIKRSIINRIQPPQISFRRYQQKPIFDTMWEWSLWRYRISLADVAEAIGISSPKEDGIDGSQIYDYFCAGKHRDIAMYCMRDVECTRAVYYCINFLEAPFMETYAVKQTFVVHPVTMKEVAAVSGVI
jgi:3'-5' exonuclease